MSADDDLRLAWMAHREGRSGRRDALLTLAVAAAEPEGATWVERVRDFLVATHPGHLYDGFYQLDEALGDRRVVAALTRLRQMFPETRVRRMILRAEVLRGPYVGRRPPIGVLLDDLLAPSRAQPRGERRSSSRISPPDRPIPQARPEADRSREVGDGADSIVSFYLNVLLGVAMLCALVVEDSRDGKRAA